MIHIPNHLSAPDCPNGCGRMLYLSQLPFVVNGRNWLEGESRAVLYGCVQCSERVEVPTGNELPAKISHREQ